MPNTSTVPPFPSMKTEPDGPNVGVPPTGLGPLKVMSFFPVPPWIATSQSNVAVAALVYAKALKRELGKWVDW